MRIFIARHGQTEWNVKGLWQGVTDTALTEVGKEQARQLAESLVGSSIKKVYTSNLQRANITGQTVADRLGIPCEIIPGIHEIGLGEWQGYTWAQIREKWPELSEKWMEEPLTTCCEGGETYQHMVDRFVAAIHKLLRENDQDILVVSHSGCLYTILKIMENLPVKNLQNDGTIPNAQAIELDVNRFLEVWPLGETSFS